MIKTTEAIKSISEKKEKLRKAFEALQSHPSSSSLGSFSLLEWKDLEDYFSPIEKSLQGAGSNISLLLDSSSSEVSPRPELRSLCVNMDAKGLRSYINDNRGDLDTIRAELGPAILCAPNPALLVLDAVGDFYPPNANSNTNFNRDGEVQINRRICVNLLDKLELISPVIELSVRERAKEMAEQWRAKIPKKGDNGLEIVAFLKVIGSYNLVSEFELDDVMDLFISVSRKKQAVDLVKCLGFTDKLPNIIQKMNSKGRQLDSVKLIHAFNLVDKFPQIPLLKAYIAKSKKLAEEVQKKGNNSVRAQNEAITIKMDAVKSVLKVVDEHKLETKYPRDNLVKRIVQLEQIKAGKKRVAAAGASNSNPKQSNKRPWSSSANSMAVAIAANPYPPLIQTQPQLGVADHAPYTSVYGLAAAGSVYNTHGSESLISSTGPTGNFATTNSLYSRLATYNGYPLSSLPSAYGNSLYP